MQGAQGSYGLPFPIFPSDYGLEASQEDSCHHISLGDIWGPSVESQDLLMLKLRLTII